MYLRSSRRVVARSLFAASVSAVGSLVASFDASGAPVVFGGNRYDVVLDNAVGWTAANAAAASTPGASLVKITSPAEQAFVESLLLSTNAPSGSYWFGLEETSTDNAFAPLGGGPLSYSNFAAGEPNNGGGNNENVGSLYWTTDPAAFTFARRGQWNDVPETGYPNAVLAGGNVPDLFRAGYVIEIPGVSNNPPGNDGGGTGGGGTGGGGDGGGTDGGGNGGTGGGGTDGGGNGGTGGGGNGGTGGGGIGGGGDGGGNGGPNPIPVPPALLAFPGAAALAYYASRRMRRQAGQ